MTSKSEYAPETTAIVETAKGKLTRAHAAELASSDITPENVIKRGYFSFDGKQKSVCTVGYGFQDYQISGPGILLPIHSVYGGQPAQGIIQAQFKPDVPRIKKQSGGKPDNIIKYETPANSSEKSLRICIDCPPVCQPLLADPSEALWVTEGIKKADSGASHGICIIDLFGVWSWRGSNDLDGICALPDWEQVPFKTRSGGRRVVFICFDSDAATNPKVQQAEDRLGRYLQFRGGNVKIVRIPPAMEDAA
jgi:hypothetical protein